MPRIGLLNHKGGVGKTLITVCLAEALAQHGKRVLVVDLDPQANATRRLAVQLGDDAQTLTRCLRMGVSNGDAADYVYACGWTPRVDWVQLIGVIPADLDLEDRSLEAGQPGAHYRLRRALYGADDAYDFTLIDFPPSLKGHLTSMGIATLDTDDDQVIIPTEPEYDSVAGVARIRHYLDEFGPDLGFAGQIEGVIINRARGTALHEGRTAQIAANRAGGRIIGQPIPLRAKIAERMDGAQPLTGERDADDVRAIVDQIAESLIAQAAA